MIRVAVISDTHVPARRRALPPRLLGECAAADLILHAGDVVELAALLEVEHYGEVVAVRGNCDADDLRRLPEERVVEVGAARIGMVHDGGRSDERAVRLARRFPGHRGIWSAYRGLLRTRWRNRIRITPLIGGLAIRIVFVRIRSCPPTKVPSGSSVDPRRTRSRSASRSPKTATAAGSATARHPRRARPAR